MFGEIFPLPQRIAMERSLHVYERVMSLQDATKKMSKSDKQLKSCINILDDPEMIRLKI